MEKCPLCKSPAYQECDIDCPNWDQRDDEIWNLAASLGEEEEQVEYSERDWK